MLKKILFTALVILLVYLVVKWRQKKMQQIAAQPVSTESNKSVYYLAGSVITLMVLSVFVWFFIL